MCEFICTIPEAFLKNRQLQIAYIKKRAPKLTQITWQDQRPFNLNTFRFNKAPYHLPYRVINKLFRVVNELRGKPYVQRNWELQFLGKDNEVALEQCLLKNNLETLIPKSIFNDFFEAFISTESLANAHPINMLLVLSKFNELNASTTFQQAQCDNSM